MTAAESVRARLTAYISPKVPTSTAEIAAFESAVTEQVSFEETSDTPPIGVSSFSNDGVSVTYDTRSVSVGYTAATISPNVYAILLNAGLLYGSLPRARRL